MAKRISLNLKRFFNREGNLLRGQFKRLLTVKRGRMNDDAPNNKLSTTLAKGKDHWLINTGETRDNGIGVKAGRHKLLIHAKQGKHSGDRVYMGVKGGHKGKRRGVIRAKSEKRTVNYGSGPKYSELYQWHNKGGDPTAKHNPVERYSGIFVKWPIGSKFPTRFGKEVKRQLRKQVINAIGGRR